MFIKQEIKILSLKNVKHYTNRKIICRTIKMILFFSIYFHFVVVSAIKILPLETQITTDRYIDPNIYSTVVGSRISLPCNTTPSTGDDQVALLLFYKEDIQSINDIEKDIDDKNESKEDKFLNHKARPIYSIDAREAPLSLATHFPSTDLIDSNRLAIKFEPTSQNNLFLKDKNKISQQEQKQRKKLNRKNNRIQHDDTLTYTNDHNIKNFKYTNNKGMVYLEISNVKKQDEGVYKCRVDYRRGRTINWIITLNVKAPATKLDIYDQNSILNSTTNLIKAGPYNEGSDVNLTCISDSGSPPLKWFSSYDKIIDSIELSNTKTDQTAILLPLVNLERKQLNEIYTCKAFLNNQSIPSITRSVSLDLNLKPKEIKIISSIDKLIPSKSIELVCQASGFKPFAKLIWLLVHDNSISLDEIDLLDVFSLDNFIPLNQTSESNKFELNDTLNQINLKSEYKHRFTRLNDLGGSQSQDGSTLTGFLSFKPTANDNGKRLTCIAFNPYFLINNHYIHDSIILEVKFPPIVYLAMGSNVQHEVILKGYNVFFSCNIQANPSITEVGWKFNDQLLKSDENLGIQITNTTLLLKNVYSIHSGGYSCYATNNQGTGQSEFIQLNVQYKPFCKQTNRLYVGVSQGESVKINCEMDSNPNQDLQYIWTLNEIEITNQFMATTDQALMRFESNRSQLIYTPTKPIHYGQFKCIGISSLGSSDENEVCIVNLLPAAAPDVLSNCTQFNLTQQSFTLSCIAGFNGGLNQKFHLELWLKQDNPLGSTIPNNNDQSNEILPIQNLATILPPSIIKQSDLSPVLVLEKSNIENNDKLDNKIDRNLTSSINNLIRNDKQISNNYEISNQNVNYSHLSASINLNDNLNINQTNELNRNLSFNHNSTLSNTELNQKELRKINYGLIRKNSNKFLNMNTLNLNNSETYDRLIKRLKANKFYLMANLTSFDYPFFSVYSLPANAEFQLIVYASNNKGRSKELHLSGNTLLASHWQTENINDNLAFNPSMILLIIGIIFLILITSTILFIMKFRSEHKNDNKKQINLVNESIENLNLNQLTMNNIINDEIILNSCTHQSNKNHQFQKCELTLNGHVSFADTNLLNENICPQIQNLQNSSTIILQSDADKLFSTYQLNNNQEYNLDQNNLIRDIYLNQIILPQHDLTKFQDNNQIDENFINEKLNLINNQQSSNTHCILLSDIYSNKLSDCCSFNKSQQQLSEQINQTNELNKSLNNLNNQIALTNQLEQNNLQNTISQLELTNLNNTDCQFVYEYEDRLI